MAAKKSQNPATVYLELWARRMGDGLIEMKHEGEHAYFAGYEGSRAIRTWQERIAFRERYGFIRTKLKGNQRYGYVLLVHPTAVIQLELDGYGVDSKHLRLVRVEGPVSETEAEELLTALIRQAGFPNESTIIKRMADARNEYIAGNNHPSLNESRSFIQALLDDITVETDRLGGRKVGLPGGMANRLDYLWPGWAFQIR